MFKVRTLNNISVTGLERLPRDRYEVASELQNPDAVLLRSYDMHDMELPQHLRAVARAGAGVNNIPVDALSARGVPVFNAPGANANAVCEIVLAAMLIAARNICTAWEYARGLEGDDEQMHREMEAGKKRFVGFELPGRTLGVLGLGAVGVKVVNAALGLGMRAIGYDPQITVKRAWQLSASVVQATSVDDVVSKADFVSVHVPLTDATREIVNAERLRLMRPGTTLLNFSRAGTVDEEAVCAALRGNHLHAYVCDFPSNRIKNEPRVIALPHLGASTREAEENCAVMVVDQLRGFLEDGNIRNSVNFPEAEMPRTGGHRLAVANANVPNMLGQISTTLAQANLNILDMLNKSRGELAYTLTDVDGPVPAVVLDKLATIEGVMSVRAV